MEKTSWRRLKSRQQFQATLDKRFICVTTSYFALHCLRLADVKGNGGGAFQEFDVLDTGIGVLIPKKWAKKAVTRNAIRRQVYAIVDESVIAQPGYVLMVRLRGEFSRSVYQSCSSTWLQKNVRLDLVKLLGQVDYRKVLVREKNTDATD